MNNAANLQRDLREINFALYLDELYGIDVTQGETTTAIRKARARDVILRHGAADRQVAKGQTLGEAFHRVYGETLVADLFPSQHEVNDGQ
jgi:hypothetical protein